ncbi:hypothetical protein XO10_04215 [Marinitoga sp. 1135]|uniref:Fucose permease n=1 Tax=Marinitoga piezophila (strain DSM 14283 / JCM 11233 / KA3) TaxID=443254 RepID=H2J774_MARPK|nr:MULTISPECIES: MFS transporter [Marinitoga]AEX85266.1 fucose permease [Marinitoga piezophila KA3]APT75751.1 hypothetical protein LN42_04695 [Marinitoga sp. 1137]NUU95494.1 hypothetical protein [Marinitoga sp. 1135]NUU97421.1 hypothetical protein [Marinitoga sp. 1138]
MSDKKLQFFIFFNIFFLAIIVNSIPPLMTTLQDNYSLTIGFSSFLPLARTIGNMSVSIIGAFIIAILGLRNSLLLGIIFEILGVFLFIISKDIYTLIFSMFFIGASMGQTILSLISMFDHLPEEFQKYGLLHAFFGFGGITGPLIISFILRNNINYKFPFYIYEFVFLFIFFFIILKKVPENVKYKAFKFTEALSVLKNKFIIYILVIFIMYSGVEIGAVTWAGNLFTDQFNIPKDSASIFISLFWVFFTIGRLLTDTLYKKFNFTLTTIFSLFSAITLIIMISIKSFSPYAFSILGIMLGPIFPVTQKFLNSHLSHREVGLVSGIVSLSIGIGASIITTLMGFVGDFSILYSYLIPITGLLIVFIFSIMVRKL